MTRKIQTIITCIFCLFLFSNLSAQDKDSKATLKFNSTPDHMWEVGVNLGGFFIAGDVQPRPGFGAGIHVRRALDYAWSVRLDVMYGQAYGLEPRLNSNGSANPVLSDLGYSDNAWFYNHKTNYWATNVLGVWSLNSFGFKNQTRKMNWYLLGGPGINTYKTFYDATDDNGNPHNFNNVVKSSNITKQAKAEVKDILDGDYETRAELAIGRRSKNGRQYNAQATIGAGVAFRISDRFNIGLEHQATVTFGNEGDLLDGHRHRNSVDLTQSRDIVNFTNVSLNFNLGSSTKKSEPLWWVSPLDLLVEDVAEVRSNSKLDMTDTDADGVIDILDQEKNTMANADGTPCPVDASGVILDSDRDGVVDCLDKEPHTPANYIANVDADGVAAVPTPSYVTKEDMNQYVDAKIAEGIKSALETNISSADWFLPMIHFDLNKHALKDDAYGKLRHIAVVMLQNPDLKIVAEGHTDKSANQCYNDGLSYKRANTAINYLVERYGIDRSRFVLTYGGEATTLVPTESANLVNRRVEFRIAKDEVEMTAPSCDGKRKSTFSGNKQGRF